MPILRITRAGVAGTLVVLIVAAVCIRLGVWQLDRLEQRRAHNRAVAERLAMPPVATTDFAADTAGLLYRIVDLRGVYDDARTIVRAGPSYRGAPGVHVYAPLRLAGGEGAVLVNRGWLPAPDAATVDLSQVSEPGIVRLRGIVVPFPATAREETVTEPAGPGTAVIPADVGASPRPGATGAAGGDSGGDGADGRFRRVWFRLDLAAIRRQLPYPVPEFYVQALPDSAAPPYPVRLAPPALNNGPHLSYAIQWFAFAAIALIGWGVLAVRRGEVGRVERSAPDDA